MVWAAAIALASAATPQNITAGGATFPFPMYSKWFDEYHKRIPSIEINYQSQGSGFGIQQVTAGLIDFGASDGPMTDEEVSLFRAKRGFGILHFPALLGANVPAYNLPGATHPLNFTPEALAGIFLGKITMWNDPAITSVNPGTSFPNRTIIVVHRADGSGTTYIWTDYLSTISKEWESRVGRNKSVKWPIGLGGKGNEGVAGQIKQIKYSLGYVELTYALQTKMTYGRVRNSTGEFIAADLKSVSAAAAAASAQMPDDFRVSIVNAPGKGSYPISSFTWLLVPEKIADAGKKRIITELLRWVLTEGQNSAAALSYARLPQAMISKELKLIGKIQ
jgi:phosphate transport system substrate-binding protein